MFRLELLIDDKYLAAVMHALPTKGVQISGPYPVRNARKIGKKIAEAGDPTTGPAVVLHLAAKHAGQQLTRSYIIEQAEMYGVSALGVTQAVGKAIAAGVLKKTKTKGTYNVPTKEKK